MEEYHGRWTLRAGPVVFNGTGFKTVGFWAVLGGSCPRSWVDTVVLVGSGGAYGSSGLLPRETKGWITRTQKYYFLFLSFVPGD